MHGRHGRKRQSFFLLPYSQQPFALPQLSPYTHSRHNTAARKKGQLVPPQVKHLLSLSRVPPVSVRSKQLPALGPSYGRKERTQALSHSGRMRTHCRRVTKRQVKGGRRFQKRTKRSTHSSDHCGWEFPKLAAPLRQRGQIHTKG